MKRTIIVECILFFILAFCIAVSVFMLKWSQLFHASIQIIKSEGDLYNDLHITISHFVEFTTYGVIALIISLADIVVMVLIAINNIDYFKPIADKFAARKEVRKQAKAKKAQSNKQARIEQLQAKLNELKKDGD